MLFGHELEAGGEIHGPRLYLHNRMFVRAGPVYLSLGIVKYFTMIRLVGNLSSLRMDDCCRAGL